MINELFEEKRLTVFKKYRPEIMNIICFILIFFLYKKTETLQQANTLYLMEDKTQLVLKLDENVRVNKFSNEILTEIKILLDQNNAIQNQRNNKLNSIRNGN